MNADTPDAPDSPMSAPADAAPAEAPKKRTRTRKPAAPAADAGEASAAAPAAVEPAPAEPAPAEAAADAEPVKPARKPRARKAPVAAAAEEAVVPAPVAEVAPVMEAAPVVVAQVEAAPVPAQAPVVEAGESSAPQEDQAPAAEGEGGQERGRSRRRGRRGAGRGDVRTEDGEMRGDAAEAGADAPQPAQAVGEPLPVAAPSAPDTGEVFASLVSGEFDALPADETVDEGEAEPEKRVLLPDADAPKLHKVLAQSGIGSRRDMEQMIQEGRVEVNGEVAHTGMRISFGDRVTIEGKPVRVRIAPPAARVIAYHKPVGEVVTHDDPQQRPTVFRKLPRLQQGKWQSVGRLDINTEGLLLFTNSGDLANKLMHPRFGVEREYAVRVLGTLEKPAKSRLLEGVEIDGQAAAFKSIEDGGGEGVNHWYRVVISEGRNREVRKLFDAVGLTVSRLIRVRYGCVVLPRGLKRGACVDLGEADVKALRQLTGVPMQGGRGEAGRQERPERGQARDGRQDGRRGDARPPRGGDRGDRAERSDRGDRNERNERTDRDARPNGGDRRDGKPARPPQGQGQQGRRQGGDQRPPRAEQGAGGRQNSRRDLGDAAPRELREPGDPSRIPNPLQQTYDKRAIQRERSSSREHDFENGPIPNPLQQTYDKRFVQGNRDGGGGRGGKGGGKSHGGQGGQPDPMKTSVGYIGADAFTRKMQGKGGGRRGGR